MYSYPRLAVPDSSVCLTLWWLFSCDYFRTNTWYQDNEQKSKIETVRPLKDPRQVRTLPSWAWKLEVQLVMLIAGVSLSGDTVDRGVFMIHKETKITVDSGIIFFHVVSRTKTGAQWQMRWGTPGWGNHRLSRCHSGSYRNLYRSINVTAQKLYQHTPWFAKKKEGWLETDMDSCLTIWEEATTRLLIWRIV